MNGAIIRYMVYFLIIIVVVCTILRANRAPTHIEMTTKNFLDSIETKTPISYDKENGVLLVLCRESDLEDIVRTISQIEMRFNKNYQYPYVFLNNDIFSDVFVNKIQTLVNDSSNVHFGVINVNSTAWLYPQHINQTLAAEKRETMMRNGYGHNESYHFMNRFYAGYFFDHPLLQNYDYYWRIEPKVELMCNIKTDPFHTLRRENKLYGYMLLHSDYINTIPTLWEETQKYMQTKKYKSIAKEKDIKDIPPLLSQMLSNNLHEYHGCHFWSNFEIASFSFFRSAEYRSYFNFLEASGGFFYERWRDAHVHTLALGLFANSNQLVEFDEISYSHSRTLYCPAKLYLDSTAECSCTPTINQQLDWNMCKANHVSIVNSLGSTSSTSTQTSTSAEKASNSEKSTVEKPDNDKSDKEKISGEKNSSGSITGEKETQEKISSSAKIETSKK